jgi:hypothetical protein
VLKKLNVEDTEFRFTGLTARTYFRKGTCAREQYCRVPKARRTRLLCKINYPPWPNFTRKTTKRWISPVLPGSTSNGSPLPGANSYEVKVFQKRKGGLVLVDSRVTKNRLHMTVSDLKKLKEGEMVWEVRAQQADRSGKVVQQRVSRCVTQSMFRLGRRRPPPEIVPTVE